MKNFYLLIAAFLSIPLELFSQASCSNPLRVDLCPSIYLANQTNAAMGDDMPGSCNIAGQDLVYEINAPNGADNIFVSIINASAPLIVTVINSTCTNSGCSSRIVGSGNSNLIFPVSSVPTYYLWVDASSIVTYGISIAGDTGSTWVNIPNTRGNLGFDSGCAFPVFNPAKPYFQVTYNNVYKTDPMTLAPLNVPGNMCITTFFENTTGIEAVKRFQFIFNPAGYSSVSAPVFLPGNYLPGSWVSSKTGNTWIFDFFDNAGTNSGDFSGTPNSCLSYTFCFDVTPLSNNPAYTDVDVTVFGDGRGVGFSGFVRTGCCPLLNPACNTAIAGGGGGSGSAFHYTYNDPPLPVKLLDFSATMEDKIVSIDWSTASESNNSYFTIEKSKNSMEWTEVHRIVGAGNSTQINHYHSMDEFPFSGISYYRLKQTDFDGKSEYFKIVSVDENNKPGIKVYPNPASGILYIESQNTNRLDCKLYNMLGEEVLAVFENENNLSHINISGLCAGIYFLFISREGEIVQKERVVFGK